MKAKKLFVSILAVAVIGMMTACTAPETETDSTSTETVSAETEVTDGAGERTENAETDAENTAETESAADAQTVSLGDLAGLLEMKDADTAELFGGGEENWTEDKSFYIGRIYEVSLYDELLPVYTSCDDDMVASVSVWISNGEREVTEEEVNLWVERVTEFAASEPVYNDTDSEAGSKNWKWSTDGKFVSVRWMGNILTMDMNIARGELK